MTQRIQWIRLKFPPARSTMLTPIQESGKETIYLTKRAIRYRRVEGKGGTCWFSDSHRLAVRCLSERTGCAPAKPIPKHEWHSLKRNPPADYLLQKLKGR